MAKNNRKSKTNTGRNAPKRKRPQVVSKAPKPNLMSLAHRVCAITDPFCPASRGAKWPDATTGRTLAYQLRGRTSLLVDSNGRGGILFTADYNSQYYVGTISGASLGFNGSARIANTVSTANGFRLVSMGLKLRNVISPMLSSGIVRIRMFPQSKTLGSINPSSYNASYTFDIPLQDCKEVCLIPFRTGERSTFFNEITNIPTPDPGDLPNIGWMATSVFVDGAPATSLPLDIEVTYNWEVTFPDDEGLNQLLTESPAANTLLTQASSHVAKTIGGAVKTGVVEVGKRAVSSAVGYVGRLFGTAVAGPAGGHVAGLLTNYAMEVD